MSHTLNGSVFFPGESCGQGAWWATVYSVAMSWTHLSQLSMQAPPGISHNHLAQTVKNPPAMQETQVQSLGQEDPPEKGMVTHSSVLAWRIPWTEKSGGLQSMELQRVKHN